MSPTGRPGNGSGSLPERAGEIPSAATAGFLSGTLPGLLAILLWSTVVAFSRRLCEELGTFTSGALLFLLGGSLSLAGQVLRRPPGRSAGRFPPRHLWGCGALFVFYELLFYSAIGLAVDRRQVLEVGLINYLWIGFTLLLSVPLLKKRASPWLGVGLLLALAGVALAVLPPGYSWPGLASRLGHPRSGLPYLMALLAALAWGFYSNLSRRWAAPSGASAVPIFLLATGAALALVRLGVAETSRFTPLALAELGYTSLFPTTLGYIFWDLAMRRGHLVGVASLSFFIPLFSTAVSSLCLGVGVPSRLWSACLLVISGAGLCRFSLRE